MTAQFIYTMRNLRRYYPPDREVLKGINLSFFPGAKIGVIGSNGSGKSSLLKIMAGLDDGYTGEAKLTAGFTVGFLSQEPDLDPDKDVLGNVTDGVAESKALLDRYNDVCAAMGEPDADFDVLRETLAAAGLKLRTGDEARQKLNKLRSMYEPYVHSTAKNLMIALPPWQNPAKTRDNWQAGPWDRVIQAKGLAVLGQKPVQPRSNEEHF